MAGKKSKRYVWQYVIGLGFLSGLWMAIGINPGRILFQYIKDFITKLYSHPLLLTAFLFLPAIIMLYSVYRAHKKGRWKGIVAVCFGFAAGLLVFSSTYYALVFLIVSVLLGLKAADR